jgi:hypothetical protein
MASIERSLDALRPEAQRIARLGLHIIRDDLGLDARVVETLRSKERQAALQKSGDSDVAVGWHTVGLAWDTLIYRNGVVLHDDKTGEYTQAGHIWQALDCRWPIKIARGIDYGHVEYHPGFTLQQFLNGQKGGVVA